MGRVVALVNSEEKIKVAGYKIIRVITIKELRHVCIKNKDMHAIIFDVTNSNDEDLMEVEIFADEVEAQGYKGVYILNNGENCELDKESCGRTSLTTNELKSLLGKEEIVEIEKSSVAASNNTYNAVIDKIDSVANKVKAVVLHTIRSKRDLEFYCENIESDKEELLIYKEAAESELLIEINKHIYQNNLLSSQIKEAKDRIAELTDINEIYKDEIQTYKFALDEIECSDTVLEEPVDGAVYAGLLEEYSKLEQKTRENSSDRVNELVDEIKRLEKEVEKRDVDIRSLKKVEEQLIKQVDNKNSEIASIKENASNEDRTSNERYEIIVNKLKADGKLLQEEIDKERLKVDKYIKDMSENKEKLDEALREQARLRNSLGEKDSSVKVLVSKVQQLQEQVSHSNEMVAKEREEQNLRYNEINSRYNKCQQEIDDGVTRLEVVNSQLSSKENQYNKLFKLTGTNEKQLESVLSGGETLKSTLEYLRRKVNSLQAASGDNSLKDRMSIEYAGKAQILTVIGSGSFGVTTAAVSIANSRANMGGKVVIVDLDFTSPKVDVMYKKSPLRTVNGVNNDGNNTSLGILANMGADFVEENIANIAVRVYNASKGSVDYISNFNAGVDESRIRQLDIGGLLRVLGNMYDYIVIDSGKVGCSDVINDIIEDIFRVSNKVAVVCNNNPYDLRNARVRVDKLKLNVSKAVFVLNMSTRSGVDDEMAKYLKGASKLPIPFISDLYGKPVDWSKSNMTKGKLEILVGMLFSIN